MEKIYIERGFNSTQRSHNIKIFHYELSQLNKLHDLTHSKHKGGISLFEFPYNQRGRSKLVASFF